MKRAHIYSNYNLTNVWLGVHYKINILQNGGSINSSIFKAEVRLQRNRFVEQIYWNFSGP